MSKLIIKTEWIARVQTFDKRIKTVTVMATDGADARRQLDEDYLLIFWLQPNGVVKAA